MKNKIIFLLLMVIMSIIVDATVFSPQGNIDLKSRYALLNVTNATIDGNITAAEFIGGGGGLTGVTATATSPFKPVNDTQMLNSTFFGLKMSWINDAFLDTAKNSSYLTTSDYVYRPVNTTQMTNSSAYGIKMSWINAAFVMLGFDNDQKLNTSDDTTFNSVTATSYFDGALNGSDVKNMDISCSIGFLVSSVNFTNESLVCSADSTGSSGFKPINTTQMVNTTFYGLIPSFVSGLGGAWSFVNDQKLNTTDSAEFASLEVTNNVNATNLTIECIVFTSGGTICSGS